MLTKLILKILAPFFEAAYFIKYNNIWNIKSRLQKSNNKTLLFIYTRHLSKRGSWIGHNSKFNGTPVFPHGIQGIFISGGSSIGKNAVIFQQVTIGSNTLEDSNSGSPIIGNNVYIGAGAKIIGKVKIGNNCRIGANAVVYKDMTDNSVAVCSPTRIIKKDNLNNKYYSQKNGNWVFYDNGEWVIDNKRNNK